MPFKCAFEANFMLNIYFYTPKYLHNWPLTTINILLNKTIKTFYVTLEKSGEENEQQKNR